MRNNKMMDRTGLFASEIHSVIMNYLYEKLFPPNA